MSVLLSSFHRLVGLADTLLTQLYVLACTQPSHAHMLVAIYLHQTNQFERNKVSFLNSGAVCNCPYKAISEHGLKP